jgi:predicted amidohydrolase
MRSLDNHVWYVVAQNSGRGSCIVNPCGEMVASNEADEELIYAKIDTSFRNKTSVTSTFYNRYWRERRPSTYSALNDANFRLEP